MTPAVYAPDATGVPALWPWVIALPPRIHCATPGCTARPPKPRPGDAPADAVWCAACRVAQAPAEAAHPAREPAPCPTVDCVGTAASVTADTWPELAPFCRRCRSRATSAIHRGTVHRQRIAEWLREGLHSPGFASAAAYLARRRAQAGAP